MQTLADLIQRDGGLDPPDAVQWALRLARAVEPLHARGGAHGSLCAEAIKIRDERPDGDAWLCAPHAVAPPVGYHGPERAAGGSISPADDVWAVAVTLYYALTGTLPFPGSTDDELAERMASGAPAPLAVFDAGDDELQAVLDGALERVRADRVIAIRSLLLALERWLAARGRTALPALELDEEDEGPTARVVIEALASASHRPADSGRGPPALPRRAPRTPLPPPPPPGRPVRSAPLPPPPPAPHLDRGAGPPPLPGAGPPVSQPTLPRSTRPKTPPPPSRVPSSRPPQKLPPPPPSDAGSDALATPLVQSAPVKRDRAAPAGRPPKHVEPPRSKREPAVAAAEPPAPRAAQPKRRIVVAPWIRNTVIGVSLGLLMAGGLFMLGGEPPNQPAPDPGASPPAVPTSAAPSQTSPPPSSARTEPLSSSGMGSDAAAPSRPPPGDLPACLGAMFPPDTFESAPEQGWICEEKDPRRGADKLREEVVRAGVGRDVTGGMREWAMLGWYELPAFVAIRARCCPTAEPIALPPADGTCRSMQEVLRTVGERVDEAAEDDVLEEAVSSYSKTVFCLLKSGSARLYGRYPTPRGGEDTTFQKTLARAVGRPADPPPDGGN